MLEGVISLASYGMGTGGIAGNILFNLEQEGVFAYVLPFLMIFAIIFGLLSKMKMFENKGINVILSLAVSLMALQLNFVSYFFREIFPRLGVVMSILLVTMIILGFFVDFKKKGAKKILTPIFFIAVIIIVVQSFSGIWWTSGIGAGWGITYWLEKNLWTIIGLALAGFAVLAIISNGGKPKTDKEKADAKVKRKEKLKAINKYYEDMLVEDGK